MKMKIKKSLVKIVAIIIGYILGLIVILPWPWGMRLPLSKAINSIRNIGVSTFRSSVLGFVENVNVNYKMGKGHGVNESILYLNSVIKNAESTGLLNNSASITDLADFIKHHDFQHMTDKEYEGSIDSISKKIDDLIHSNQIGEQNG